MPGGPRGRKSDSTKLINVQLEDLHEKASGFLQQITETVSTLQTVNLSTSTNLLVKDNRESAWKSQRSGNHAVVSDIIWADRTVMEDLK